MTILGIVSYRFLPVQIGGQKAIEQWYRSLGNKADVVVVSTTNNDISLADSFSLLPVFNNNFFRYGNLLYIRKLGRIILQKHITHLCIEHPYMGWLAILLRRKYRIPLIVHSHNIESIRFKSIGKQWWKLLWHYEKYVYKSADFVFFMTEADRRYAIDYYHLSSQQAFVASYGTDIRQAPSFAKRQQAKRNVCDLLQIDYAKTLLLFNGSFDYEPNALALRVLLDFIVPELNNKSFPFTLLICGRNIPPEYKKTYTQHVIFLDYVPDIFLYNLAADVFVNPVTEGGGIKTKLVEALAAGANAVSVKSGAAGVDPLWCGGKLYITDDNDWPSFANAVYELSGNKSEMTEAFYQHFFIGNITDNVIKTIS